MSQLIVQTENGKIEGRTRINYDGDIFYSFQGIPYAKPPIGDLRFKAPQPVEPWHDTLDATNDRNECYSHHMVTREICGAEDCLHLNVFTKRLTTKNPVLVFVHGGGFVTGSSKHDICGPEFLLTQEVVLVTLNYRLGLLGFLRLEESRLGVPGNAGLKDIVHALKWVKNNIANFGGDCNNVTVFGESAGAALVHLLVLSPVTDGLFHKAIMQSGCAFNNGLIGRPVARDLSEILSYNTTDEKEILEKLKQESLFNLLNAQDKLLAKSYGSVPTAPVIENESDDQPIIWEESIKILKSGNYKKIPMVFGYNSHEGMLMDVASILNGQKPQIVTTFNLVVPQKFGLKSESEDYRNVTERIKQFYFGGEEPSERSKEAYYNLYTDCLFLRDKFWSTNEHLKNACNQPIFFYKFSFDTSLNWMKRLANFDANGACHGDELGYLFKNAQTPEITAGSTEDIALRKIVKLWTNFATYGNPTPENESQFEVMWKPVTTENFSFLDINEELTLEVNPERQRMEFWSKLYDDYGISRI